MKPLALLILALAGSAAAEFSFKVEATYKGKPIPKDQIKLVSFDRERVRTSSRVSPGVKFVGKKRSNPQSTSINWCGSVNHATTQNPIKVVHALYKHPGCSKRSGVNTYPQAMAMWAGIDGDTHLTALLQSGTTCRINNSSGIVTNEAWWQWYPSGAWTITTLPVAADDWFRVTINATSSTSGKVTISNESQGYSYTMTVTGGEPLARVDADWMVECPYYGSGLAGFANFEDAWFTEASATRNSGSLGILGATQYQITNKCASEEYSNSDMVAWAL